LIAGAVLGLLLVEAALYIIIDLTHWSVIRTVDMPRYLSIFESGRLDLSIVGPTYAVALALLVASLFAFERRVP
jgi:hypothetical protein